MTVSTVPNTINQYIKQNTEPFHRKLYLKYAEVRMFIRLYYSSICACVTLKCTCPSVCHYEETVACVCACVCVSVRVRVSVRVCVSVRVRAYVHVRVSVHVCVSVRVSVRVRAYVSCFDDAFVSECQNENKYDIYYYYYFSFFPVNIVLLLSTYFVL